MENRRCRNILLPYDNYVKIKNKKQPITSIRICRDHKIKKFEIGLVYDADIKERYNTKNLAIRLYNDPKAKYDVIEFTDEKSKSILKINLKEIENKEYYKNYIESMLI